jgi:hypothetical protein
LPDFEVTEISISDSSKIGVYMQRFLTVVLFCVFLPVSSGFAMGHNRLDKNTYIPHRTPSLHAVDSRFSNDGRKKREFHVGQRVGSPGAHQKIVFSRNLRRATVTAYADRAEEKRPP